MKNSDISLRASSQLLPSLVFHQKCSLELTIKLSHNFYATSSFILLVRSPIDLSRFLTTSKTGNRLWCGRGMIFLYPKDFFFPPTWAQNSTEFIYTNITHGLMRLRENLPGGKRGKWGEKLLTSSTFSYLPLSPMTLPPEAETSVKWQTGLELGKYFRQ